MGNTSSRAISEDTAVSEPAAGKAEASVSSVFFETEEAVIHPAFETEEILALLRLRPRRMQKTGRLL